MKIYWLILEPCATAEPEKGRWFSLSQCKTTGPFSSKMPDICYKAVSTVLHKYRIASTGYSPAAVSPVSITEEAPCSTA